MSFTRLGMRVTYAVRTGELYNPLTSEMTNVASFSRRYSSGGEAMVE